MTFPKKSRFCAALQVLSALAPAAAAAYGTTAAPPASHDAEVIRTVGAGFAGPFRALDLLVDAPAMLLPFGTRVTRAGLASAVVTGIVGALAFDIARALVAGVPEALAKLRLKSDAAVSPRLLAAVSAVSVLTALLSPAWQREASAPGGAVTGAMLVVFAIWLGIREDEETLPATALVLGLAASYEPIVLAAAVAAVGPWFARWRRELTEPGVKVRAAFAFGLGLLPLALGLAAKSRAPESADPLATYSLLERTSMHASPLASIVQELGAMMAVLLLGGMLLAAAARSVILARPLAGVILVGFGAALLRVPCGPDRYSASVLATLLVVHVFAAMVLAAVVVVVARLRIPLAEASAALVVVVELVLPVRALDDTATQQGRRVAHAADVWNDVAWGSAPPASVLLVRDRGTMRRIAVARATGAMRADLVVVPAFDVQGREGQDALVAEPKLAPLYRDIALGVPPEELSLSRLGAERAVLTTFDPAWDRALARHLVPVGLVERFEPEPRGASDRKKALEAFGPARDRLVRVAVARKDAALAGATTTLLRARAIGMAATGERELIDKALDDLRTFSKNDPVDAKLVRRMLTTKGPIDVKDL